MRVKTIDGPVTIETEGGDDRVVVSSDAGVLDALRALLTLDTGAGIDSVRLDDAAELDANTAIITAEHRHRPRHERGHAGRLHADADGRHGQPSSCTSSASTASSW